MKNPQLDKIKKLDLEVFEKKLNAMAMDGDLDFPMGDSEPDLSLAELEKLYQTAKRASYENAIIAARKNLPNPKLPFGRHLQMIRDKSGLSQKDIAGILKKDISFIDKIENGTNNPLTLLAKDLADIMQLFRVTITELQIILKSYLSLKNIKPLKARALARSSNKPGTVDKGDSLAHAFDAASQAIAKLKGKTQNSDEKIDSDYLEEIKKVLKDRGEYNLLK